METIAAPMRVACLALFLAGSIGASWAGPQISGVRTTTKCIALTFDDGPHVSLTPRLLDILRAQGAKATFFVVGSRVQAWPAIVRRASQDGHEIGNHTWSHPALPKLGSPAVQQQLSRTDAIIQHSAGRVPKVVRAPFGSISGRVDGLDKRPFIGWSVDSLDWRGGGSAQIANRVLSRAGSGSIVLMHDTKASTVAALPAILSQLAQRGFRLVTVSELLSGRCGQQRSLAGVRDGQSVPAARQAAAPTEAPGADLGPRVTKSSPTGNSYSYREGSRVATYTINGRTFTYERD